MHAPGFLNCFIKGGLSHLEGLGVHAGGGDFVCVTWMVEDSARRMESPGLLIESVAVKRALDARTDEELRLPVDPARRYTQARSTDTTFGR